MFEHTFEGGIKGRATHPEGVRFLSAMVALERQHQANEVLCHKFLRGFRRCKAAHPDDGWVKRDENSVCFSYPLFDMKPQVGDLIALGSPTNDEGEVIGKYRLVKVERVREKLLSPDPNVPWYDYYFRQVGPVFEIRRGDVT